MGWEWRVFFRASDADGAFEFVHPGLCSGCEKRRTDVYQPVSDEVGLKERGGRRLELKIRSKRDANGWEKWSKSRVSEADASKHVDARHRCVRVSVAKRRVQECVGDALVEQTELQVTVGDGPVQIWRTVAVEGKRARCAHLVGEVLLACTRQATGGRLELCGGYPAFVLRLANEAAAQAEPAAPGPQAAAMRPPQQYGCTGGAIGTCFALRHSTGAQASRLLSRSDKACLLAQESARLGSLASLCLLHT